MFFKCVGRGLTPAATVKTLRSSRQKCSRCNSKDTPVITAKIPRYNGKDTHTAQRLIVIYIVYTILFGISICHFLQKHIKSIKYIVKYIVIEKSLCYNIFVKLCYFTVDGIYMLFYRKTETRNYKWQLVLL